MKRYPLTLGAAACIMAGLLSCAKTSEESTNESLKRYLDAWVQVHYPQATENRDKGIYLLEEHRGSGEQVDLESKQFLFVDYIRKDLSGNISSTNLEDLARQLGSYSQGSLYGYTVWGTDYLIRGLRESLDGMQVGGSRTVLIPSWLMTYENYSNPDKYFDKSSESASAVYTLTVKDIIPDIKQWQGERLSEYSAEHLGGIDSVAYTADDDALKFGFYYKTLQEPVFPEGKDAESFTMPNDTTVYIHYTGRFLNGQVFDTSLENVAKQAGIYTASKTYGPQKITWAEKAENLYMGTATGTSSNSSKGNLTSGFAYALHKMRPYEKVVTAFWSDLGYGSSGSGSAIPGYCPLVFEIELVDKE